MYYKLHSTSKPKIQDGLIILDMKDVSLCVCKQRGEMEDDLHLLPVETCHYCSKQVFQADAIDLGWEPDFWRKNPDGTEEDVNEAVCPDCQFHITTMEGGDRLEIIPK